MKTGSEGGSNSLGVYAHARGFASVPGTSREIGVRAKTTIHDRSFYFDPELFQKCSPQLSRLALQRSAPAARAVITRQRPGTGTGVVFLTLENETGPINVVVWSGLF